MTLQVDGWTVRFVRNLQTVGLRSGSIRRGVEHLRDLFAARLCRCAGERPLCGNMIYNAVDFLVSNIPATRDHLGIESQPGGFSPARPDPQHQVWEGGQGLTFPKVITSTYPTLYEIAPSVMTVDVNTAIVLVDGHHLPATLERSNLRRRRDVNLRMVGSSGGGG
jgi:hypothetical protein